MFKYAGIVVNNSSIKVDKLFTYAIPEKLIDKIKIGHRVKVPFGKGNKNVYGFILEFYEHIEEKVEVKSIISLCEEEPLLTLNDIKLIMEMKKKYLCTYLECIKVMIPPGINKGTKTKIENFIFKGQPLKDKYKKENYMEIYNCVREKLKLLLKEFLL